MEVISVYGLADHERSRGFLEELCTKIGSFSFPLILGGDFNLIRSADDKNNDNLHWPLIDLFNAHTAAWALWEIPQIGVIHLVQSPVKPSSIGARQSFCFADL
jgi:hypothetical protein